MATTTNNSAYKVHVQHTNEAEVNSVNIEDGAMLHTTDALYMGHNGQQVIVYPQGGASTLGWARYDDTQYTTALDTRLTLVDGVEVIMPNNAGNIIQSDDVVFYNGATKKVLGHNINDVYVTTVVFKMRTVNANQTHVDVRFVSALGAGEIERVRKSISFHKGNDTIQDEHEVFQYYTDSNFVDNGIQIKITADGADVQIWDVIYFIQRTQNGRWS